MKYTHIYTLLLMLVFATSCGGQNKPDHPKEKIKSETNGVSTSGWIDTKYEYTDSTGASLIIQNSLPKGGTKYTGPNGEVYNYVVFWTRIINETDHPLELKIDFPIDSYEILKQWINPPAKYFFQFSFL